MEGGGAYWEREGKRMKRRRELGEINTSKVGEVRNRLWMNRRITEEVVENQKGRGLKCVRGNKNYKRKNQKE